MPPPSKIVPRLATGWLAVLMACAMACGCRTDGRVPEVASTVVLLTIDTWRRDATGFLGGLDPSPTPFLDGLANRGLVATDAVAPVPLTGPSHWSMLSGRWPWRDGVRLNGDRPVETAPPGLPEILERSGWTTAAFVSSAVLDHRFGFARGFEEFDDGFEVSGRPGDLETPQRRADATVAATLAWLERQDPDQPIFLWIHLFDPHFPYDAPSGPFAAAGGDANRRAYLGEVAFADSQARLLMEGLRSLGRPLEDSVWIFLADHGEGLGDHQAATHGFLLHGAAMRIPLVVAGGSVPARSVSALGSTVDVPATILDLLNLEVPPGDGRSLLRQAPSERRIPLESDYGVASFGLSPARGLRSERWLWERSPVDHLWDVVNDPGEDDDLADRRPDIVASIADDWAGFGVPDAPQSEEVERLPEDLRRRLAALGYLSSGSSTAGTGDLREFVAAGERWYSEVIRRQSVGDFAGAEDFAIRFLERYPAAVEMWVEAGFVAAARQDFDEAERRFRRASELDSGDVRARLNLANTLWLLGRRSEGETEYVAVLDLDPQDLFALYNLGALREQDGRWAEAAQPWRRFLELYPDHDKASELSEKMRRWQVEGKL